MHLDTHLKIIYVVCEGNDIPFTGPAEVSRAYLSPDKVKTYQGTVQAIPQRIKTVYNTTGPRTFQQKDKTSLN